MTDIVPNTTKPHDPRPAGDFYGPTYSVTFYASLGMVTQQPDIAQTTGDPFADAQARSDASSSNASSQKLQFNLDKAQLDHYAANLTLDCDLGAPVRCSLTLTPPYEDALAIIDKRLIRYGSVIKVNWGYRSNTELLSNDFYFLINAPKISFSSREVTISLVGQDVTSTALLTRGSMSGYDRKRYPTDLSILEYLVEEKLKMKLKLTPEVSSTLSQLVTYPIPFRGNDWALFKKICYERHLTFTLDAGNVVTIHSMNGIVKAKHAYKFFIYRQPDSDMDIPMTTFTANTLQSAFYAPSLKSIMSIIPDLDSNTSVTNNIQASKLTDAAYSGEPDDESVAGTDQYDETQLEFGVGVEGERSPHTGRDGNSQRADERYAREASMRANTHATFTAPGHPDVLPPMVVRIDGVGKSYSGNYFIRRVKHELGRNGYDMTVEIFRTLSGPDTVSGTKPAVPPTPDQLAPQNFRVIEESQGV